MDSYKNIPNNSIQVDGNSPPYGLFPKFQQMFIVNHHSSRPPLMQVLPYTRGITVIFREIDFHIERYEKIDAAVNKGMRLKINHIIDSIFLRMPQK